MEEAPFRALVEQEWAGMPPRFRERVTNVAVLVEDEPSAEVRAQEGLEEEETLLGLYHGIPNTARGSDYGVGGTVPDTITLYRLPILAEAYDSRERNEDADDAVRRVVRETVWHEVGLYLGLDEDGVGKREDEGTNKF